MLRLLLLLAISLACSQLVAQTNRTASPWEKEISAFEASDRVSPPPQNAILFVGSSSIRKWTTLTNDFPGKQVINRGFGGSQIADSTALADRIIFPYHPHLIVFYAGDNDLAAGLTANQVAADYRAFVEKIHARLPNTTIAFISIKPCPLRWRLRDEIVSANSQIKAVSNDHLKFIDVYTPMLGPDGRPQPDLFLFDRLHPSPKCYALWVKIINPYLE